jgi:inorganic pyrophosphatase
MEPVAVIIETIKGSNFKCDYVPDKGYMKLKKTMPLGLVFPFDFGFIPHTEGGDGDPLDVLVISELKLFVGCALECRIIGAIKAEQREKNQNSMRNDRLIAIPIVSNLYSRVQKLSDFSSEIIGQIENFFINYNQQAGKAFKPLERLSANKSFQLMLSAKKDSFTKKIELFIPLINPKGKPYNEEKYNRLNATLTKKFGGLTVYSRAPVEGLWKKSAHNTITDNMIIYEVMTSTIDRIFWNSFKKYVGKEFNQEEIVIRVTDILLL